MYVYVCVCIMYVCMYVYVCIMYVLCMYFCFYVNYVYVTTSSPTIPTHLHSPELHVGMPLAALLEKTLESKANDLLPQIMDAVESLRALKPQQGSQSDSGNTQSLTGSQTTPSGSASNPTTEQTAASTTSKKELGSLDLGLPIDIIPGLGAPPKKDLVGGGGEGKTTKPKLKQSDGATLKDGVKGPTRPKMATTSGNKGTAAVKEGAKEREKEDSKGAIEKESEMVIGKEKVKMSCKPKNPKEEAKDKPAAGQNKESLDKPQDRAAVKSHTGGGKEKDKSGDAKKGGKKDGSEIEPTKTELKSEQKEASKAAVPKSKETEDQLTIPEKEPQDTDTASGSGRRKQHTPTRRSARIASISESREQSKQKESESEEKEDSSPREESDGSEGDTGVEKKQVKPQRRKRRKRLRETNKASSSSRKKARVLLSSSSEESEQEESEADLEKVEESYKSESEAKEEEEKPSKKVKSKRRRRVQEVSQRQPKRSRKRDLPQSQEEDTEPQGQPKRSKIVASSKRSSTTLLKKQFKLKLHRFSSPPVKTRYNRLVKPNRKYSPAGELSNLESEENSEEQKQEEEEEEEREEGEKALSESVEGENRENTSEEELPPKPATVASKTSKRRTKKKDHLK